MKVEVNVHGRNGAKTLRDVMQAQIEEMEKGVPEKVMKGIREMATLMTRFNQRMCNAQAIPLGDVNRFNTLCYELFPGKQDGGEFFKEKAPEAEPKARADGGRIPFAERRSVYEVAIDRYGIEAQLRMVIEEMSELTKELCKFFRGKDNLDDIADETADVAIMLEQLQLIFGINDKVCEHRDAKVQRLAGKLGIEVHDGKRSEMR